MTQAAATMAHGPLERAVRAHFRWLAFFATAKRRRSPRNECNRRDEPGGPWSEQGKSCNSSKHADNEAMKQRLTTAKTRGNVPCNGGRSDGDRHPQYPEPVQRNRRVVSVCGPQCEEYKVINADRDHEPDEEANRYGGNSHAISECVQRPRPPARDCDDEMSCDASRASE